ncbi:cysteine and histidine rich domain containing 1 [Homo sapiens]|uniref:Cysteine and histidine rich domain containing 1 n=1 Tax=Homo sapiens TaxID=9606 RepID=E9PIF7_HUMAN|nr:cysteine and histidine rich domain containing 1 [Homo sapiens]KAI4073602.1 cysteine and histidine rich domain containing 1 [Homo sapiens]
MALLCYNRGCGQRFDPETNSDGKRNAPPALPPLHLISRGGPLGRRVSADLLQPSSRGPRSMPLLGLPWLPAQPAGRPSVAPRSLGERPAPAPDCPLPLRRETLPWIHVFPPSSPHSF